jgi:hypothetical protein
MKAISGRSVSIKNKSKHSALTVKLSQCLIKHYATKATEVKVHLYKFLDSALDRGDWSALHLGHFTNIEQVATWNPEAHLDTSQHKITLTQPGINP